MKQLNLWILVNIDCIECGVTSKIVGVFTNKEVAETLAKKLEKSHNWRQGGQNSFEVFLSPLLDTVADEYNEIPA